MKRANEHTALLKQSVRQVSYLQQKKTAAALRERAPDTSCPDQLSAAMTACFQVSTVQAEKCLCSRLLAKDLLLFCLFLVPLCVQATGKVTCCIGGCGKFHSGSFPPVSSAVHKQCPAGRLSADPATPTVQFCFYKILHRTPGDSTCLRVN